MTEQRPQWEDVQNHLDVAPTGGWPESLGRNYPEKEQVGSTPVPRNLATMLQEKYGAECVTCRAVAFAGSREDTRMPLPFACMCEHREGGRDTLECSHGR